MTETKPTMSRQERHVLYPVVWTVLLILGEVLIGSGGTEKVQAQDRAFSEQGSPVPRWHLVVDGEPTAWPESRPEAPLDSLRAVGRRVLDQLRREGYYYARIDSVATDTRGESPAAQVYVHRGPQVQIQRLRITDAEAISVGEFRTLMETGKGNLLRPERLEADIQVLLDRYEEAGHPLAQIRVSETRVSSGDSSALHLTLEVDEGPALWLKRVEAPEDARTSSRLLAHLANLDVGAPLQNYDPEAIRRRLRDTELFESVETPELRVAADGGAILHLPLEEESPGAFDLALGYLPPSGTREGGQIVGNGRLLLENLFGGGRRAELTLDRRPGQTSLFDLALADPYLFGMPLRGEGQFRGEQRDSTYGKRTYRVDAGYRMGRGVEVTASFSREVVRPGQAGTQIQGERQRIPRSTGHFYGLGIRYERLDREYNPRRGVAVDIHAEQGRKQRRSKRVTTVDDTIQTNRATRQERFQAQGRVYLPVMNRQVIAIGGEASVLLSNEYDRSDLFRLGGAQSLRGYDEDRFLGNVAARGLLEYRLQLDRRSYAYAFGDLGYVERPAVPGVTAEKGWYPGYGLGIQIQTGIGLLSTTYALSPEVRTVAHGRIHLGLTVGL